MKSMLKDAGILFAITLVAGLLLGCVYQITKEPIARQEALAQENACREVFSDAESFEAVTDFTEEAAQAVLNEGGYSAASVNACQEAKDASGTVLGYVLTVTTHEGYGGDIQFTVAIIPKIATKAFVRKNNSKRKSSSGNNHLINHLPKGITTKTNRPNNQAINLNETPGKENIACVKPKNKTGIINTPGNQYNKR